jgi:hypothetical protein
MVSHSYLSQGFGQETDMKKLKYLWKVAVMLPQNAKKEYWKSNQNHNHQPAKATTLIAATSLTLGFGNSNWEHLLCT